VLVGPFEDPDDAPDDGLLEDPDDAPDDGRLDDAPDDGRLDDAPDPAGELGWFCAIPDEQM